MANINAAGSVQSQLNRMNPASADAKVGDVLADLIAGYNALVIKYNALCAKLDADAGVTDTTYVSLVGASTTAVKDLESRY